MHKLLIAFGLALVLSAKIAFAEVWIMNESQLGQDVIVHEKNMEGNSGGCEYATREFDPQTLDYKSVCLSLFVGSSNGVSDSFAGASSSWLNEIHTWSDTTDDMPSYQNVGVDLERHYLEVYETAQRDNVYNEANWMLMQNSEVQQAAMKELRGRGYGGIDIKNDGMINEMRQMWRENSKMVRENNSVGSPPKGKRGGGGGRRRR